MAHKSSATSKIAKDVGSSSFEKKRLKKFFGSLFGSSEPQDKPDPDKPRPQAKPRGSVFINKEAAKKFVKGFKK